MLLGLAYPIDGRNDSWGIRGRDYLDVGPMLVIQIILDRREHHSEAITTSPLGNRPKQNVLSLFFAKIEAACGYEGAKK